MNEKQIDPLSDNEQLDCDQDVTIKEAHKALNQIRKFTFLRPYLSERYVESVAEYNNIFFYRNLKKMHERKRSKSYDSC